MAYFGYDGHKLAYTIHGKGPRTTVLMPAVAIPKRRRRSRAAGG